MLRTCCGTACFYLLCTVHGHIVNNPKEFQESNPFELNGNLLRDAASAAEAIADGLPKYSKVGKIAGFLGKVGGALTKLS